MDDPRTHFLSQLDLSKTRVRAFEGFVLLCGGASGADAHPVKSVRHLIQSELTNGRHSEIAKRVRLAEETNDWFDGGVYSDLVTFEEHLAGLSAVVVLIVETAGSIAELGAFSVSTPFIDRLLVIISQDHYNQDSFIRLGPIQKLENASPESVLVYDWHERAVGGRLTENFELIRADLTEVVSKIQGYVSPSGRQHVFRATEPAHIMSLICELCDLFGALNESDIAGYLAKLSLPVDAKQLSQYIFLLQKCQILFMKPRGHGRYFYVENWSGRVSFAYQEGAKFNKERLKVDTVSYYEVELPSRASIVKSIRRA